MDERCRYGHVRDERRVPYRARKRTRDLISRHASGNPRGRRAQTCLVCLREAVRIGRAIHKYGDGTSVDRTGENT